MMKVDPHDPEYVAYVEGIVDEFPPLTEAQRARLAVLFRPGLRRRRPRPADTSGEPDAA
jgi:hypothetical protein